MGDPGGVTAKRVFIPHGHMANVDLAHSDSEKTALPVLPTNVASHTKTGRTLGPPPHSHGGGSHGPNIDYELDFIEGRGRAGIGLGP